MLGYDFDRQKPIGNYIVDFYCKELMPAIEIDGSSHNGKEDYDMKCQRELEVLGVSIIRFDDIDVKKDMNCILKALKCRIQELNKNGIS